MTDIALPTTPRPACGPWRASRPAGSPAIPRSSWAVVLAFGVLVLLYVLNDDPHLDDLLSMSVIPAFFIGLPQPGRDGPVDPVHRGDGRGHRDGARVGRRRRMAALALACFVPFAAGAGLDRDDARPGVDRRGSPVRVVVRHHARLAGVDHLCSHSPGCLSRRRAARRADRSLAALPRRARGRGGRGHRDRHGRPDALRLPRHVRVRLWVPWAMFHSGGETDGTASLFAGNPALLPGLPALPVRRSPRSSRSGTTARARTGRLRGAIAGVVILGLAALALAMTTGNDHNVPSKPIPYNISK